MQDIIKEIRQYLKLSQTEMAKKLNVGFATINRWENGHAQPARLAQEKLLKVCEDCSVPVYEMIIGKIKRMTENLRTEGRLVLYHGSKSGLVGPIMPISRERCENSLLPLFAILSSLNSILCLSIYAGLVYLRFLRILIGQWLWLFIAERWKRYRAHRSMQNIRE